MTSNHGDTCALQWNPTGFVGEVIKHLTQIHSGYFKPEQSVSLSKHLSGKLREFDFSSSIYCTWMFVPQHFWEAVHIQDISNCVSEVKELLSVLSNEMVSWVSVGNCGRLSKGLLLLRLPGEWLHMVDHHYPLPTLTSSWKDRLRKLTQPTLEP